MDRSHVILLAGMHGIKEGLLNDKIPTCFCSLQVQQSIEFLVNEALRMGSHPDDRDSVTDMTLLMFTCKAGAAGVGDGSVAAKVNA